MRRRLAASLLAGLCAVLLGVAVALGTGSEARPGATPAPVSPQTVLPATGSQWVATWTGAATGSEPGTGTGLPGRSVRNVLRVSAGGTGVRVEVSNEYGTRPVTFTDVTVALAAAGGPAATPGTMRRLTFGEGTSVTVPAGGTALSDATTLEVPAGAELLVSLFAPEPSGPVTYHRMAQQTSYLAPGDQAAAESGAAYGETSEHWRYVTAVQVLSRGVEGAVVVLGDSLTDGITSTPGADHRWTDYLAARLREEPDAPRLAVLNQGISGNRLLRDGNPDRTYSGDSGLRRLPSDVLRQPGARVLVVQLGINDIIVPPRQGDPGTIVTGLRLLTERAHASGLRVVGATLTPFAGHPSHSRELERIRQRVNREIRAGGVFDAVADFDAALRDPAQPLRLRPAYDSGDGLHPSDAGYEAMAGALDLSVLGPEGVGRSL
nr:SGNH/GDSL hydrolase family protein [Streptomyces hoynatensis]